MLIRNIIYMLIHSNEEALNGLSIDLILISYGTYLYHMLQYRGIAQYFSFSIMNTKEKDNEKVSFSASSN